MDSASLDLWAHALTPEVSSKTLVLPTSLVVSQRVSRALRHLQSYSSGLKSAPAFILEALTPSTAHTALFGARSKSPIAAYVCRLDEQMPLLVNPSYPSHSAGVASNKASAGLQRSIKSPYSPAFMVHSPMQDYTFTPRTRVIFSPSSLGFGLDETRLVRTGTSRFVDTALIANKLESLAGPSLTLPSTPVTLLGLG